MLDAFRILSLLASAVFLCVSIYSPLPNERPSCKWEAPLFWALFAALAANQLQIATHSFGNYFTYDEFGFARAYAVPIGRGEPAYGGVTQGVAGAIYYFWYKLKGFAFSDARQLSAIIGTLGSLATFFAAKREFGPRTARLAALTLQLSSCFILFSSVALEVSFSFLAVPCAYILLKKPREGYGVGILLALSIFTYPGVVVFYACCVAAAFTSHREKSKLWFRQHHKVISGFLAIFNLALVLHHLHFLPREGFGAHLGLLQGGGKFGFSPSQLLVSLEQNLSDLLIGGTSWYLEFLPRHTFVEMALWGPLAFGCVQLYKKGHKTLLLALLYAFVLNLFISQSPGLRRLAAALPVIAVISAFGLAHARRFFVPLILAILLWNGLFLVPRILREPLPMQASFPPGFPDSAMRIALKKGNVYVDQEEVFLWFMIDALQAQQKLIQGEESQKIGKIYFDRNEAPSGECLFYMTWKVAGPGDKVKLGPFVAERRRNEGDPDVTRISFLDSLWRRSNCQL